MELQQEPHVFQRQRRIRGITRIRWIRATTGDNTDQKKQISLVDFLLRIHHFTFSLTDVIFTRKFCLFGISSFGSIFLLAFLSLICGGILPQSERRQPGAVLPPENVFFWKTPTNKAAVNVFFWKTPPATTTAFSDSFMLSSVKRLSLSLCHRCRKSSNSG